jgi:hypothetical protein
MPSFTFYSTVILQKENDILQEENVFFRRKEDDIFLYIINLDYSAATHLSFVCHFLSLAVTEILFFTFELQFEV